MSDIFKHWIHWSWLFQSHWAAIGFVAILDLSLLYMSSFIFKKIQYGVFLKPCGKFIVCCGPKKKTWKTLMAAFVFHAEDISYRVMSDGSKMA